MNVHLIGDLADRYSTRTQNVLEGIGIFTVEELYLQVCTNKSKNCLFIAQCRGIFYHKIRRAGKLVIFEISDMIKKELGKNIRIEKIQTSKHSTQFRKVYELVA